MDWSIWSNWNLGRVCTGDGVIVIVITHTDIIGAGAGMGMGMDKGDWPCHQDLDCAHQHLDRVRNRISQANLIANEPDRRLTPTLTVNEETQRRYCNRYQGRGVICHLLLTSDNQALNQRVQTLPPCLLREKAPVRVQGRGYQCRCFKKRNHYHNLNLRDRTRRLSVRL